MSERTNETAEHAVGHCLVCWLTVWDHYFSFSKEVHVCHVTRLGCRSLPLQGIAVSIPCSIWSARVNISVPSMLIID